MNNTLETTGKATSTVEVTMINAQGIALYVNGKEYFLPYERCPWFKNAKVSDVLNVSMVDKEEIRWETLDVDLEIESLIYPEKYPLIGNA